MKSFATSICPIKNPLAVNMRHPRAIPVPSPRHPRIIPARRDHPPTDLKTVSFRCHNRSSARRPCPEGSEAAPRYLRAILAPSQRHPSAIPALSPHHPRLASRSSTKCWPIRGLFHGHRGAHWVLQSVFGTATLPTGASEPSPRGEAVIYRPFGTATLPTGSSEPSPRGEQSPNRSQNVFFPVS